MPFGINAVADRAVEFFTEAPNTQAAIPNDGSSHVGYAPIPSVNAEHPSAISTAPNEATQISPVLVVWVVGMIICALFFLVTHLRSRRDYILALPLENDYVNAWLKKQKLWRSIQIRYSDSIDAPMTYGIWKPVILFPKSTDWQDESRLQYVLTHEMTHIRRFDILLKLLFIVALCVHWFNPLVWVMYVLANRDMELSCDEKVVWTFGETMKSAYALTLIGLEEKKSGFSPLCTNFAKNAIEERIVSIMKIKKMPFFITMLSVVIVAVLTIGVLSAFSTQVDEPEIAALIGASQEEVRNKLGTPQETSNNIDIYSIGDKKYHLTYDDNNIVIHINFNGEYTMSALNADYVVNNILPENKLAIDIISNDEIAHSGEIMEESNDIAIQHSEYVEYNVDTGNDHHFASALISVKPSDESKFTAEEWAEILVKIEKGEMIWEEEPAVIR
jgi:beta-lactamase regulating signal transducer with metallopeptidase domain